MHCEGDKIYDRSGDCPVSNIKLVLVNDDDKEKPYSIVSHSQHEHLHVPNHSYEDEKDEKYYCTMLCEGNKTYPEPGDCPVCVMHLKKLG